LGSDAQRLEDILTHADELASYIGDCDIEDFLEEPMRRRAVERLLTIIAEASKELSQETRDAIHQPWREIIRFRDKGIHGYNSLSPTRVYAIATDSVPALRQAVATYLAGEEERRPP
jgi:uncharacterized protein with HEPN domain